MSAGTISASSSSDATANKTRRALTALDNKLQPVQSFKVYEDSKAAGSKKEGQKPKKLTKATSRHTVASQCEAVGVAIATQTDESFLEMSRVIYEDSHSKYESLLERTKALEVENSELTLKFSEAWSDRQEAITEKDKLQEEFREVKTTLDLCKEVLTDLQEENEILEQRVKDLESPDTQT